MDGAVRALIPGGRWVDGRRHHETLLRPLLGRDEAALVEAAPRETRPRLVTETLARCVLELGPEPLSVRELAALTVGDREALLWQIRRATVGERIDAVVTCPTCTEKAELELNVGDLLQPPYPEWTEEHEERIDGRRVRFRLPTGEDQEAVAQLPAADTAAAARELAKRCVSAIDGAVPDVSSLMAVEDELGDRMANLDPQAEAMIEMRCPSCGSPVSAALDAASYLYEEVAHRGVHLLRDVHVLASVYHWSEADILAMTAQRRSRYLELIEESRAEARS